MQNRFNMLNAFPCDDFDATADTIPKVIHETALLVAGRHQGKKPAKLSGRTKSQPSYQAGQKCYGRREEWWWELVLLKTTSNTFKPVRPSGREWRMTSWLLMRNKSSKPLRKQEPEACQMQAVPQQKTAHIHHGRRWHLDPQQGPHRDTLCWVLPGAIQV